MEMAFELWQSNRRVTFSDINATVESMEEASDSSIQRVWAYLTVKQLLGKEWVPTLLFVTKRNSVYCYYLDSVYVIMGKKSVLRTVGTAAEVIAFKYLISTNNKKNNLI